LKKKKNRKIKSRTYSKKQIQRKTNACTRIIYTNTFITSKDKNSRGA